MRLYACFAILFLSLLSTSCYTQVKTMKTADKKALNYANEARISMSSGQTDKAIEYLKMAIEIEPEFIDAWNTMANFYLYKNDMDHAMPAFIKTIELDPKYDYSAYILLARIYLMQEKFDEAESTVDKLLAMEDATAKQKKDGTQIKQNCVFSKDAIAHPVPFDIKNLGTTVNSKYAEYFPALTADDEYIYFTKRDNTTGHAQEDIWYSRNDKKGGWLPAQRLGETVNTEDGNEGAHTISPNGKYLIFTKCQSPDGMGSCDLYISKRDGEDWSVARNLGPNINTGAFESQASISGDSKTLYFVRAVSKDNTQIMYSTLDEKTGFAAALPLSDAINTEYREQRPFIHPDNNTLYFLSDGHPGMGGDDIFVSRKDAAGNWGAPVNLGYPINSSGDEGGIFISSDGKKAYIASERKGGLGIDDIYSFDLYEAARPSMVTYVKGTVTDIDSKLPLQANIQLFDVETGEKITTLTSDPKNGFFMITLPVGKDYMYNVSKDGYLFYSENFSLKEHDAIKPYNLDVALSKIKEGVSIVLKNIFFETNKAELKEESKTELDKLVDLLTKNPMLKIEIGGHTDNVGADADNLKLSDARAKSVMAYLVAHGISADRLTARGYGETKPIADNNNVEGRALNRRTEFKVTSK